MLHFSGSAGLSNLVKKFRVIQMQRNMSVTKFQEFCECFHMAGQLLDSVNMFCRYLVHQEMGKLKYSFKTFRNWGIWRYSHRMKSAYISIAPSMQFIRFQIGGLVDQELSVFPQFLLDLKGYSKGTYFRLSAEIWSLRKSDIYFPKSRLKMAHVMIVFTGAIVNRENWPPRLVNSSTRVIPSSHSLSESLLKYS